MTHHRIASAVEADVWRHMAAGRLTAESRLLFVHLATAPDISPAGVTALTPARWSHLTGLAPRSIEAALEELTSASYLLVDHDTSEVLVHVFRQWNPPGYGTTRDDLIGGVTSSVIRDRLSASPRRRR